MDPKGKPLYSIISARIDRGFQKSDDETWISYRRNYFTLVASFSLVEQNHVELGKVPSFPIYIINGNIRSQVRSFSIRLTAFKVLDGDESEEIALIQHTAKRYKGPRQPPSVIPAVPGLLPDHAFMRDNANYRSAAQLQKVEPFFFRSRSLMGPFAAQYPEEKVAHVVLFDRVQFTPAGGGGSQKCKAVVQLMAELDDNVSFVVAHCETPPFTLRNRSPGNYFEDGTLIPRSRKAAAALAAFNNSIGPMSNNPNHNSPDSIINGINPGSEETHLDLASVYGKSNEPQLRLKKISENKRKNSFVTERPDLRVARLSSDAFAFESSRQNVLGSEGRPNSSGAGELNSYFAAASEKTGFNQIRFENTEFPKFEVESDTVSALQQGVSGSSVPVEKRRRGRPKVTAKQVIPIAEPDTKNTQGTNLLQNVDYSKLDAIGNIENQELPQTYQSQPKRQNSSSNNDTNDDFNNDDDDDTDDSEDYEEVRKRDMMRLRSRPITSSIHNPKDIPEPSTTTIAPTPVGGSNSSTSAANTYKLVQPTETPSSTPSTAGAPSGNFEFQSPIGRARPSASRETHGPSDGSPPRGSRRSSRQAANLKS